MEDVRGVEFAEILISADGKAIWVNTEEGCVARLKEVSVVVVNDMRNKKVKYV
ncbi:MAG: hypothetical protein KAU20_05625 [Nanoarchaeota archaeon]|nr:hypothetical protein [Nanoarchaeota archaeon]